MPARSVHYCGVHYFKDGDDTDAFYTWLDTLVGTKITQKTAITYVIYQTEVCPTTQRDHVQFYFQAAAQVDWKKAKEWLVKAGYPEDHFDACNGSSDDNKQYCSKEESRKPGGRAAEHGVLREVAAKKGQGSREDLKKVKLAIDEGADWQKLLDLHFGTCARHDRFLKDYLEMKRSEKMLTSLKEALSGSILRPWQQNLLTTLETAPCTRTVHWLWEAAGNAGKTWMSRYCAVMKNALVLQSMKKQDMIHLISKQFSPIVIFDLSRTSEDGAVNVVYEVAEVLKNGYICSGKYDSKSFSFAPPHVVVLANFAPDRNKLSQDRWNIINIVDSTLNA